MFKRKFIRLGSALLMILALTLPVAPLATPALAVTGVTAVSPTSGPVTGGTPITITGSGFQGSCLLAAATTNTTAVTIDSVPVTGFAVTSDTTITGVTGPHPAAGGPFTVSVTQGAACGFAAATFAGGGFTYFVPTPGPTATPTIGAFAAPTGVSPTSGSTAGGTVITITGTGFSTGVTVVIDQAGTPAAATGVAVISPTQIIATTAAHAAGTFAICVLPGACGPAVFTYAAGTPGTVVGTPSGAQNVSGTVVGTAPGGTRPLANVAGAPSGSHLVPAAHVVLVSQTSGAAFGTHTNTTAITNSPCGASGNGVGAWCITAVPPGSYRLSVADNDEGDGAPAGSSAQVGCSTSTGTPCGHLINQQLITVLTSATVIPTIVLAAKGTPGALPQIAAGPPVVNATAGIFGEARDATTGNPVAGAVVTAAGTGGGSTTTGADGRFSIGVTGAGPFTVTITATTGTCTAGTLTDLCTDVVTVVAGGWSDPAFLLVGAGVLPTPSTTGIGSGVLQGVIPLVFRDTDTSRTGGVDIETEQIRVLNAGPARTIACLDFRSSDVDGRVTTVQRQCLDLNPNAAGIFSGDIIPSGIMGMAEIYSIDFDGGCLGALAPPLLPGATPTPPGFVAPPTLTSTATTVPTATATPTIDPAPSMLQLNGFMPEDERAALLLQVTPVPSVTPGTTAGIQGCIYDVSDLQSTIMYRVAEADNATAGTNGLTCEDVDLSAIACGTQGQTTVNRNQNIMIPVAFKDYGGTPAKWDSVVNVCMTSGVPGRQPVVMEFNGPGGVYLETRSADPGGCISFNMRDITYLPSGVYAIALTSTGLLGPVPSGIGNLVLPNAMFGAAVAYSRQGKLATAHNGISVLGGGQQIATESPTITQFNRAYLPLVFGDYTVGGGAWWTGIGIVNYPITGTSGTVNYSVTVYDDAGTVRGVTQQGISGGATPQYLWLGQQPGTENRGLWFRGQLIIPLERNFRGAVIVDSGDASGAARPIVFAHHTNYARLAAISYNGVRDEVVNPTVYGRVAQAANTRPCLMEINIGIAADTCMWAAEAVRVSRGPTTGVRLFNTGATPENIDVLYYDSAGVEWADSRTTFTIGPFSTATIFLGTDGRLPAQFNGSIYLQSSADVTAIANVIDYGVTTRDSARSYNMPTQSGLTQ